MYVDVIIPNFDESGEEVLLSTWYKKIGDKMKLLLHACCAPCSVYCVETLRKEGIEPTMYWFNPNIHPFKEYVARRDCFKDFCEKQNLKHIIEDNYGLDEFCKNVSNDINARCVNYCYPIRMRRVFEFAKENGYDTVSTTLLYSIYQKHEYIKKLCEDLSKEFGIDFLYRDFRVGFEEGHQKAYEMGLYLQKYCGCVFSEEDRYSKQIRKEKEETEKRLEKLKNKKIEE